MKKILFVSSCTHRGTTTGLTGKLIDSLSELDRTKYEIALLDINYFEEGHKSDDYKVDKYVSLPKSKFDGIIKRIPYIRSKYASVLAVKTFKRVLSQSKYNLVAIYQIPSNADKYVQICNSAEISILMYPWGSDILRCSERAKKHIRMAFDNTDFVGGAAKSNCILAAQNDYGVPSNKILFQKNYLSGVGLLQKMKDSKSRPQMIRELNIPSAEYYIVCGYNGARTQNHNTIVDALIVNKLNLPNDYLVIFPMTYGATQDYYEGIKKRCEENLLNVFFLREFISNEKMAYLHLLTDLFVNIQDTDCGNAFMIEALFAKNRIVTGRWLHYEQFEQFGVPYHLIDKPEALSEKLSEIFSNPDQKPEVPEELIEMYRIPKDYVKGSYWTNIVDRL